MKQLIPETEKHFKYGEQIYEGTIYTPDDFDETQLRQVSESVYQAYIDGANTAELTAEEQLELISEVLKDE